MTFREVRNWEISRDVADMMTFREVRNRDTD